jgi:hypothetical protein
VEFGGLRVLIEVWSAKSWSRRPRELTPAFSLRRLVVKKIAAKIRSALGLRGSKRQVAADELSLTRESLDAVRYEPVEFAKLVPQAFYNGLQPLLARSLKASPDHSVSAPVTGPELWRHTHDTLVRLIRDDVQVADPGHAVRDAYVRAMVELYIIGPKPVSAPSLAERAAEVLHSPTQLPREMEGYDIGLTRIA